jgi:hypothetical protein
MEKAMSSNFLDYSSDFPVYHGFSLLEGLEVEGFMLGKIGDFAGVTHGEAFVIAPDGSRAGILWEISTQSYFENVFPIEFNRWGVWAVSFPHLMKSSEDARRNFAAIVPVLKVKWEEWRSKYC